MNFKKNILKILKSEWFFVALVMLIYSAFALYDLGDRQAPVTFYNMKEADSLVFDFGAEKEIESLAFFLGHTGKVDFRAEFFNAQTDAWEPLENVFMKSVFAWNTADIPCKTQYIRLTCISTEASVHELAFINSAGNTPVPVNKDAFPELFDEWELYPERISFRNSTYFDEVYHARTAYEYIHGLVSYENSHPPLGKILIALGVLIFGMNPFGFRIVGTLIGILMIPCIYLFARKMLKERLLASLACILFTFDFMHFAQTRIATIDVYVTFFIILMYYFMYCYLKRSYENAPLKQAFLPLGASGVCMGLAIASKWTGVYGALGLAVVFFYSLFSHRKDLSYVIKTVLFCLVFFVAVPLGIYILSYLPYVPETEQGFFSAIWENQQFMLRYHSKLTSTHPYASPCITWPFIVRPIWYYSGILGDTLREGISSFGNPLVWWPGVLAFFFLLIYGIKKKDRTAGFLVIGYLSQYLPWFFITRPIFIYHYFPSVIFVTLMNVYSLKVLKKHMKPKLYTRIVCVYGAAVVGLFLLFYPVLSGQPVEAGFVSRYLRWFPSWVLTRS